MSPDVDAIWWSPMAPLTGASGARLRHDMRAGPICIVPRRIELSVADHLDRLDLTDLPILDAGGTKERIRHAIESVSPRVGARAAFNWLVTDLIGLVDLYCAAFDVALVRVQLGSFSVASPDTGLGPVLITTYRGSGVELFDEDLLAAATVNQPITHGVIRHVDRGTVAILRGGKPRISHRFPAGVGAGRSRLSLTISGCPVD